MREITSARLAKTFPEKERTAPPIPLNLEVSATADCAVVAPHPNPRKKRAHTQNGADSETMHNLKSKEGVPKPPRPTKEKLRAALSRALRLHAPDLLEAWPGYEAEQAEMERAA